MSRFYDEDYNPLFKDEDGLESIMNSVERSVQANKDESSFFGAKNISGLVRKDRDAQDANMDSIVRSSFHRREIMMAKKIIDENTLCLAGVDPCYSCQKELDNE
jgi:hypothetical protein